MKKDSGKRIPSTARKATASGAVAKKTATAKAARKAPRASKDILASGIEALDHASEDAFTRQSRVFESILGLGGTRDAEAKPTHPLTALDPFGFRKFEDVFDQRVARALENLGVPSAQAVAALTAEVEALRARIARLEAQAKKR